MSAPPDMVASQIFYYLKRELSDGVYAFETNDGVTIPIFSAVDIATGFLENARIRGYVVSLISPSQMFGFHEACRHAGGKFLQLDPKADVLKGARVKNLIPVLPK
jgi:hypothetical protein